MFSDEDKAACARREVKQRRKVYFRLVRDCRMSQQKADREIAIMEEIAADYEAAANRQGKLI